MLANEKLVSLKECAKYFRSYSGKKPNYSTIWRWAVKGCRGTKLETVRFGVLLTTSEEAIDRFMVARQQPTPSKPKTNSDKKIAIIKKVKKSAAHSCNRKHQIASAGKDLQNNFGM